MSLGIVINQNSDPTVVDNWALVSSGIVVNIIVADLNFIQAIQSNYDYLIDINGNGGSPHIGYSYNSGANTFSAPNIVPSLYQCKIQNLQNFNVALQTFSDSHYTLQTQFRFFTMYYLSIQNGLTNRAAYITPLFTWANSIMSYAATYTATVMAQTDPATALNYQWDFSNISADPNVTLLAAIQINN